VKGFQASVGNIAILLLPKFDVDLGCFSQASAGSIKLIGKPNLYPAFCR
jgi:hypothetical protein